jgi:hypothetical protein
VTKVSKYRQALARRQRRVLLGHRFGDPPRGERTEEPQCREDGGDRQSLRMGDRPGDQQQ